MTIDELDRSLHPDVLHSYLQSFIKYSQGKNSQLIVTTHDTTLLKRRLIRQDEVWFIQKGPNHSSTLSSLEEYKFNARMDWQKGYLQGRFGGVPIIHDFSWLGSENGEGKT